MKRLLLLVLLAATATAGVALASDGDSTIVSMPFLHQQVDGGEDVGDGSVGDIPDGDGPGRLLASVERAFVKAQADAAASGVELTVTSGWRSRAHQQGLYEEAVAKYGSPEVARQWVLPPGESAHVRGEAIDVGPPVGAEWLRVNGVRYGLCQRYANEAWHFELLAAELGSDCPALEPHA